MMMQDALVRNLLPNGNGVLVMRDRAQQVYPTSKDRHQDAGSRYKKDREGEENPHDNDRERSSAPSYKETQMSALVESVADETSYLSSWYGEANQVHPLPANVLSQIYLSHYVPFDEASPDDSSHIEDISPV